MMFPMLDKTVRQFLRTRAALLAIAFLLAACGLAIAVHYAPWRQSFDPVLWNDEEIALGERREMADDLIARRLLDGMRRSEVVALLGEPPPTEYFRDWDLVYWLGVPYQNIDSLWLVVRFGDDERVSEYRIVMD